jgi:hypothetical protein
MTTVAATPAFLALAVCLPDLVLTRGVVRRLRRHTELISNLSSSGRRPYSIPAEGKPAGLFETVATIGEPVSRNLLSGRTLVGAFTPSCSACDERPPAFAVPDESGTVVSSGLEPNGATGAASPATSGV